MRNRLHVVFVLLFLLVIPYQQVFACDSCAEEGPQYKNHSLEQAPGYFAREFDKFAPKPGMDWDGEPNTWLGSAYQKGWVVKTSPEAGKAGALILGFDSSHVVWVGIVREMNGTTIRFDHFDDKGKIHQVTTTTDSIAKQFNLLGYIWAEKVVGK